MTQQWVQPPDRRNGLLNNIPILQQDTGAGAKTLEARWYHVDGRLWQARWSGGEREITLRSEGCRPWYLVVDGRKPDVERYESAILSMANMQPAAYSRAVADAHATISFPLYGYVGVVAGMFSVNNRFITVDTLARTDGVTVVLFPTYDELYAMSAAVLGPRVRRRFPTKNVNKVVDGQIDDEHWQAATIASGVGVSPEAARSLAALVASPVQAVNRQRILRLDDDDTGTTTSDQPNTA